MKELKLERDERVVLVDDHNYDRLSKFKWFVNNKNTFISRSFRVCYKEFPIKEFRTKHISIASEIMNQPGEKFDHKDRNIFNCLEDNFRLCNKSQNSVNVPKRSGTLSIYKGVTWDRSRHKWMARAVKDGITYNLGRFDCEFDAAMAYDKKIRELFGEF